MTKFAHNSKKCIYSGCAQVIDNFTELLAREKQWNNKHNCPSLIAMKSDEDPAVLF